MADPAEQPPAQGPTRESLTMQSQWLELAGQSLTSVRDAAGRWRDGLVALITLVTAGLVISGPDKAGDMPTIWQWGVAIALIGGMAAVVVGLVLSLEVSVGTPTVITLEKFRELGGKALLDLEAAKSGAQRLKTARRFAIPGIIAVLLAIGAWLVSPTQVGSSLQVTTESEILCGELTGGDQGKITLSLAGESAPATVVYADVDNIRIVEKCDAARVRR